MKHGKLARLNIDQFLTLGHHGIKRNASRLFRLYYVSRAGLSHRPTLPVVGTSESGLGDEIETVKNEPVDEEDEEEQEGMTETLAELDDLFEPEEEEEEEEEEAAQEQPKGGRGKHKTGHFGRDDVGRLKCTHKRKVHWPEHPQRAKTVVQSFAPPSKAPSTIESLVLFNPDQKELMGRRKLMREIEMQMYARQMALYSPRPPRNRGNKGKGKGRRRP